MAKAYVQAALRAGVAVGPETWSMAAPEMLSCEEVAVREVTGSQS